MNKRNYPLFLIDRSKNNSYPFDYITCLDRQVGFIARIIYFKDDIPLNEFIEVQKKRQNSEIGGQVYRFKKGGLIMVVEDYLYYFDITDETTARINSLMKKAFKKYIHTEGERAPDINSLGIDEQIRQQELSIERAKANFDDLVKRSSEKEAKYAISLAEATLETLKNYRDNMNIFKVSMQ